MSAMLAQPAFKFLWPNVSITVFFHKRGRSAIGPIPPRSDYLDKCPLSGCDLYCGNVSHVVVSGQSAVIANSRKADVQATGTSQGRLR